MATDRERALLDAAITRAASGAEPDPLLFWGHTGRAGKVGRECLSQWYPAAFDVDGVRYSNAEQYMMAGKARVFGDDETLAAILAADSPKEIKRLGREVRGYDPARWEAARFAIVVEGNAAKFGGHDALRGFLLGTGDRLIVEASPVDRVWGIGLAASDERAGDPRRWRGLNLLGFALMEARAALRAADAGGD